MRRTCLFATAVLICAFAPVAFAQEHFTEGPVWRVSTIKIKPTHEEEYLTQLQHGFKVFAEEMKREGLILDYKVFFKADQSGPNDWDMCTVLIFKNHAALDGLAAKTEAIRDKVLGGKEPAQQGLEKRQQIRDILTDETWDEIFLK